ncbi:hypothetical protein GFK26_26640 [Variovorax paradoxus]|uniref:Uncharacterized protein n=1 Tax=Variovorax paradoxus TaxID=34073 RepID=A0A5Q0MB20_VARPD|nr:hypothetical protein GFK26_26640 [Variovorax paradoxus]
MEAARRLVLFPNGKHIAFPEKEKLTHIWEPLAWSCPILVNLFPIGILFARTMPSQARTSLAARIDAALLAAQTLPAAPFA